jgi:heat shock protein HspQ
LFCRDFACFGGACGGRDTQIRVLVRAGGSNACFARCSAYLTKARDLFGKRLKEEKMQTAKFSIGQVVRHKLFPFRGVIFDVDPEFSNSEEWLTSIPEPIRPSREQPFYHLFAENSDSHYVAYVSEQNLAVDDTGEPVDHPQIELLFDESEDGGYKLRPESLN